MGPRALRLLRRYWSRLIWDNHELVRYPEENLRDRIERVFNIHQNPGVAIQVDGVNPDKTKKREEKYNHPELIKK